jgi:hypothetical protein
MNSLHAVITVCASVLLVLIAIGIQKEKIYTPELERHPPRRSTSLKNLSRP